MELSHPTPRSLPGSSREAVPPLWRWAGAWLLGSGRGRRRGLWAWPLSPCCRDLGSPQLMARSWQAETWLPPANACKGTFGLG